MFNRLTRGKVAMALVGLLALALVAAACGSDDDDNGVGGLALSGLTANQLESLAAQAQGFFPGGFVQGSGINVTGRGQVTAVPDLAVLSLGVEATADTVAEARDIAATAMSAIADVLEEQGVAERDIQTQFFSIQPEYSFTERTRVLEGFRVVNTLTVKVRDLDNIGPIIDGAAEAGGDVTRINSISFTLENGAELEDEARALAIQDAVAKAQQFADETGVTLGKLQFITETTAPRFAQVPRLEAAVFDQGIALPPTPISVGETQVTVTVQASYAID